GHGVVENEAGQTAAKRHFRAAALDHWFFHSDGDWSRASLAWLRGCLSGCSDILAQGTVNVHIVFGEVIGETSIFGLERSVFEKNCDFPTLKARERALVGLSFPGGGEDVEVNAGFPPHGLNLRTSREFQRVL